MTSAPVTPTRKGDRKPVQRDLSAYMFLAKGRVPFRCLGVDASSEGLGVVCFERVDPPTTLLLATESHTEGILMDVVPSGRGQEKHLPHRLGM